VQLLAELLPGPSSGRTEALDDTVAVLTLACFPSLDGMSPSPSEFGLFRRFLLEQCFVSYLNAVLLVSQACPPDRVTKESLPHSFLRSIDSHSGVVEPQGSAVATVARAICIVRCLHNGWLQVFADEGCSDHLVHEIGCVLPAIEACARIPIGREDAQGKFVLAPLSTTLRVHIHQLLRVVLLIWSSSSVEQQAILTSRLLLRDRSEFSASLLCMLRWTSVSDVLTILAAGVERELDAALSLHLQQCATALGRCGTYVSGMSRASESADSAAWHQLLCLAESSHSLLQMDAHDVSTVAAIFAQSFHEFSDVLRTLELSCGFISWIDGRGIVDHVDGDYQRVKNYTVCVSRHAAQTCNDPSLGGFFSLLYHHLSRPYFANTDMPAQPTCFNLQ